MPNKKITIVIPVFNEEHVIETLYGRLAAMAEGKPYDFEFLFVNDGSSDGTLAELIERSRRDPRVTVLDLSRNFGQHPALSAGLDQVEADAAVLMDADLEDDPKFIPQMIAAWEEGCEVVYALRGKRNTGFLRNVGSRAFHAVNSLLEQHAPKAGTFSLLDRRVIEALRLMPERNRYIPGLRALAGFRQKGILFDREARYDQRPRVSFLRLIRLGMDSTIANSKIPLKLASFAGILLSILGLCSIIFLVIFQITRGFRVSGWASLMVTTIFVSGMQLVCLGILGEYIGQILDESKRRPVYLIRAKIRSGREQA